MLTCEDEILNTTKALLDNKIEICENSGLSHTIGNFKHVIISCHFY